MNSPAHPNLSQDVLEFENLQIIQQELQLAMDYSLFTIIAANAGLGKSSALRDFKSRNSNCYYVTLAPEMSTKKQLFIDLYQELTGNLIHDRVNYKLLVNRIRQEMRDIKNNQLIIIDDAGRFSEDLMQIYQYIRDNTIREAVGLVLVGTNVFVENLGKWTEKNLKGISELVSRANRWVIMEDYNLTFIDPSLTFRELKYPTIDELSALCAQNNIKDPKAVSQLIRKCRSFREMESRIINHKIAENMKMKLKITK